MGIKPKFESSFLDCLRALAQYFTRDLYYARGTCSGKWALDRNYACLDASYRQIRSLLGKMYIKLTYSYTNPISRKK